MNVRTTPARAASLVAMLCLLTGCGNYYKVKDTASGKTYYTTSVDRDRQTAAVHFKDEKSGAKVTLPSSEVSEIEKSEYKAAVK